MKKLLLIASMFLIGTSIFAEEEFPYEVQQPTSMQDFVEWNDSAIKQVAQDYVGDETINEDNPASYYIAKVINYFLAILSFIAFLVLAYGFSLVFTDKTDEWVKKWYKFIKMASIALIIIWVSWLISIWFINIYATKVVKS